MEYKVINIKWDTDGEDIHLPTELTVEIPIDILDDYETVEYISDNITSQTGFCHKGFNTVPELNC